jgi:hypothetical protein
MKPDPREAKLPLWAKTMLGDMRRRTLRAEKERDEARQDTDPGASRGVRYFYDEIPLGLGARPNVRFTLEPGAYDHSYRYVDVRISESARRVEIMGGRSIHIEPVSSNVVHVWVRED